jgi:5'(3')-deoxyribonucleotidase
MLSQSQSYRSYTITQKDDVTHIANGRCPNYALNWQGGSNAPHWPTDHDYFMGNGSEINDGTKELREILSERLANGVNTKYIVFCDLDGVLADFEQGVKNKFKKNVDELNQGMMWGVINKSNTFFETLPWMPKGRELWSQIEQYNPIILTGVPRSSSSAVEQKIRWCKRELGPNVKVITCATKDKPKYCIDKSILIDDRTDNLKPWIVRGGKFILYDEDYLDDIVERIGRHMECELPSP